MTGFLKLMLARWSSNSNKYRVRQRHPITEQILSISLKSALSESNGKQCNNVLTIFGVTWHLFATSVSLEYVSLLIMTGFMSKKTSNGLFRNVSIFGSLKYHVILKYARNYSCKNGVKFSFEFQTNKKFHEIDILSKNIPFMTRK